MWRLSGDTVVNEICGEDQVEALFIENKKTGAKKHLPVDGVFCSCRYETKYEHGSG